MKKIPASVSKRKVSAVEARALLEGALAAESRLEGWTEDEIAQSFPLAKENTAKRGSRSGR